MDGEFRALLFDPAAMTSEVVGMIKDRIGLNVSALGFSLFEVFGSLERNMLGFEKVADAMFKWEKYAKSTVSNKELKLTFKKRIFQDSKRMPTNQVEFDLVFNQVLVLAHPASCSPYLYTMFHIGTPCSPWYSVLSLILCALPWYSVLTWFN